MQTAEFNYEDFIKPRQGDEKLAVRFFRKARQDPAKSTEEGRPIFVECDYIQISVPGDKHTMVVRPVKPGGGDALRFAKQYEHWKLTQTNIEAEGTPLEVWGKLTLAQIEEYRYFGVRTVDHLADLRDDIAMKIPGSLDLKRKAQAFLAITKEEAPMRKLQEELEVRDAELASIRLAMDDQAKIIKQLQESVKKAA
jgi:hypothetical protein